MAEHAECSVGALRATLIEHVKFFLTTKFQVSILSGTGDIVTIEQNRSEFFEVVTPLGGAQVFICASESSFGSHAFVCFSANLAKVKFYGLPKLCSVR
eukprot:sb/3478869/